MNPTLIFFCAALISLALLAPCLVLEPVELMSPEAPELTAEAVIPVRIEPLREELETQPEALAATDPEDRPEIAGPPKVRPLGERLPLEQESSLRAWPAFQWFLSRNAIDGDRLEDEPLQLLFHRFVELHESKIRELRALVPKDEPDDSDPTLVSSIEARYAQWELELSAAEPGSD